MMPKLKNRNEEFCYLCPFRSSSSKLVNAFCGKFYLSAQVITWKLGKIK